MSRQVTGGSPAAPAHDKLFATAATATRALGRLCLSVAVARAFGAEGFATYALLLVVETIALTLASSRAQSPLVTLVPRQPRALQGALLRALGRRLLRDLGWGALLLLALTPWLGLPPQLVLAFTASTAGACLARLGQGWRLATFAAQRVLLSELAALALPLAVCLLALAGALPPLESPLTLLYAAGALGQGLALASLWERVAPGDLCPELAREASGLARAMLAGSCVYSACSRLQPFALGHLRGLVAVAPFAAALTVAGPLRVFSAAVDVVLRPRLAAADPDLRPRLLARALGAQVAAALAALGFLTFAGELALDLLYGGVIPGLRSCALLAALYVGVESLGSTLTVSAQVEGAAGARRATRTRVLVSGVSLLALGPCVWFGGAQGALLQLAGVEALFATLMLIGSRVGGPVSQAAIPASAVLSQSAKAA